MTAPTADSFWFRALAAATLAAAVPAANAQLLIPTAQTREIRGEGTWTDVSGTSNTGPLFASVSPGDFGSWFGMLNVPGFISGAATQLGGFNGLDTISLDSVSLSLGGGNGPGTSAMASLELEFTYTFDLPAPATYFTDATFSVASPSLVPDTTVDFAGVYTLTGPGGEVFRHETGPDNSYAVTVTGATGALPAGTYTLSLLLGGDVAFIAPPDNANGAGGGGGGPSPLMTFRVEGVECAADWNDDTQVNSADISAFLTSWLASIQNGTLDADFNNDLAVNSGDISAFLTAWLDAVTNGC